MALKLRLKPNERVVINGCVVQNDNRRYTLTVSNFAQIIRGSDILDEEEADTPVRRAYFVIQGMLLDPSLAKEREEVLTTMMAKLYAAFTRPDMRDRVMEAMHQVGAADYYKALACLRPVMAYEETILPGVRPLRGRARAVS
jgi:flagellar protein FlbT